MNSRHRTTNEKPDTAINLPYEEYMAAENERLRRFHRDIDDQLDVAVNTMGKLKDQRDMLARGKSMIQEITNQLGISQTVMRLIERRGQTDMYIFWCLVIVFFLMVILVIYWLRS